MDLPCHCCAMIKRGERSRSSKWKMTFGFPYKLVAKRRIEFWIGGFSKWQKDLPASIFALLWCWPWAAAFLELPDNSSELCMAGSIRHIKQTVSETCKPKHFYLFYLYHAFFSGMLFSTTAVCHETWEHIGVCWEAKLDHVVTTCKSLMWKLMRFFWRREFTRYGWHRRGWGL